MPTNTDTFENGLPHNAKAGDRFICERALLVVDRFTTDDGGPIAVVYLKDKDGWSCRGRAPLAGMKALPWRAVPNGTIV